MINLLPPNTILEGARHYGQRKLIVGGCLVFVLLLIASINLASLFAVLRVEAANLDGKLTAAEARALASGSAQLEKEVTILKRELDLLRRATGDKRSVSQLLPKILEPQPPGISLTNVVYNVADGGTIRLLGLAQTRQNLLDFVATLRQNPTFKAVDSPVANLIKDRDVAFTLELKVHD
ncbi:MAG: PilN domain-containing protein [Candidatus Vogelbacteria bacterium]|nr:PilN domain-containing protein [Candidatus Vogelbacteria bacterium]